MLNTHCSPISLRAFFLLILMIFPLIIFGETTRPKIALVLSGGGARGFAHIGVLELLDEMQIPIDLVVGTSMGAVVGGLYAAGYTGAEIREKLLAVEWEKILRNEENRDDRYFRRKRDDNLFLVRGVLGYKKGQILLPQGIVNSQLLYQNYKKLTLQNEPIRDFSKMPIPFIAVATDIVNGQKVLLEEGDLASVMLASMSVPGLFPPVDIGCRRLVDGGIKSNVPVEVAKAKGADIVIVVNVGTGLYPREKIVDIESILEQLTNIYVHENVEHSLSLLARQDILIAPNLDKIDTSSFDKIEEAYLIGKKTAQAEKNKFQSLPHFPQSHYRSHDPCLWVKGIYVDNHTCLCTQTFYDYLPITPGLHSIAEIDHHVNKLEGLELFETIHYTNENGVLVFVPKEKSWGPTYLQGTFLLATDFAGESAFTLSVGFTRMLLNKLDGEARIVGTIGERTGVFAEIYQPLSTNLKWYINPRARYERYPAPFYLGDDYLAKYLISRGDLELGFGRILGEWGEIEVGGTTSLIDFRQLIGCPYLEEGNFKDSALYGVFRVDTFDETFFPHKGIKGSAEYATHSHFEQAQVRLAWAQSYEKHTLVLGGFYGSTLKGTPIIDEFYRLGGLFRLSGLTVNQLFGPQAALFNAIYYYEMARIQAIPNYPFPLYLGASIEAGNVWEDKSSLFEHSYRGAGSLFIGMDTILGPIYLGYGIAEGGNKAAYLFIGQGF